MNQGPDRSILDAIQDEFDATCDDIVAGADRRESVRTFTRFARSLIVTYQFTSNDDDFVNTMANARRVISQCLASLESTLAEKMASYAQSSVIDHPAQELA